MKLSKKLIEINVISLVIFILILLAVKFTNLFTNINLYIHSLFLLIQNNYLLIFSSIIAFIFDTTSMVVISLIISIFIWKKYSKKEAIFFSITMLFDALILFILKNLFQIQRPLNGFETDFAFPSGHATTAILFFSLLTYFIIKKYKNLKLKMIIISIFMITLISLTRLYLGVHYISDILAGLALGTFIFTLSIIIQNGRSKSRI
ncbi:MAG: phosphatase PAP2 family protein [Candidatus Nanoarchaeia archaeon]|nr:phosphatase PAP2 family protein [Candidatus Nanoarchaeia archaeon]